LMVFIYDWVHFIAFLCQLRGYLNYLCKGTIFIIPIYEPIIPYGNHHTKAHRFRLSISNH
jgi:hypothetical protein